MSALFLFKLSQLIYKIKSHKTIRKSNYKLVILTEEQESAFSFFDYIFLGKRILQKDYQHILQHELIHVKEKHSLDLLFFEMQKIVFWFNPFSYLYAYKISVLHEYIADAKTIKETNKKSFFENLILQTFQIEKIPFVNNYHKKSLLKNRIMMATKNKSKKILKMKYLLVIPVTAIMLFIASCNNQESNLDEEEAVNFSEINKSAVFPGCENEADEKAKKQCFATKMRQFVAENFNSDVINNLDLTPGRKRILVQFKVDKTGKITDIRARAPHPKLKEEAIRIAKKLPDMIPAEDINGKKVSMHYNLPIIFLVEGDHKEKDYKENDKIPFSYIIKTPVFPGCEDLKDNKDRKQCFSEKINSFISTNFNQDIAKNLGLNPGQKRIAVQFIIDKTGVIKDIKIRAPHPKLKEEALRVIKKLPIMIPGEIENGKKVEVRYNLPIIFTVKGEKGVNYLKNAVLSSPPAPIKPIKPIKPLQNKK